MLVPTKRPRHNKGFGVNRVCIQLVRSRSTNGNPRVRVRPRAAARCARTVGGETCVGYSPLRRGACSRTARVLKVMSQNATSPHQRVLRTAGPARKGHNVRQRQAVGSGQCNRCAPKTEGNVRVWLAVNKNCWSMYPRANPEQSGSTKQYRSITTNNRSSG